MTKNTALSRLDLHYISDLLGQIHCITPIVALTESGVSKNGEAAVGNDSAPMTEFHPVEALGEMVRT